MVELELTGIQYRNRIPQTLPIGELTKYHCQQMLPAGK
jgi:hypothetical protein